MATKAFRTILPHVVVMEHFPNFKPIYDGVMQRRIMRGLAVADMLRRRTDGSTDNPAFSASVTIQSSPMSDRRDSFSG